MSQVRPARTRAVRKFALERLIGGGFALMLALLVGVGVLDYRSTSELADSADAVRSAQAELTALARLLSSATDAETAQRGYVITGDEGFLGPYRQARQHVEEQLSLLRGLAGDVPARLDALEHLAAQRIDSIAAVVALRRDGGAEDARRLIASGKGRRLHDRLRAAVAGMEARVQSTLAAQEQGNLAIRRRALLVSAVGAPLAVVIVLGLAWRIVLDLRTLRRTSAELAAARDRAESADRIKSSFLATMSHELRTPLNSIIGFTGILLQRLAGPLNDEQGRQLAMVRDSSRHLLALINDVLDISKIESGQLEVAHEDFDLRASIAKVVEIVRPLAEKKSLVLQAQVDDGVGPAHGDARRVEQVLLNLLSNAIKFTDAGSVTLSAAPGAPGLLRIDVADTGIGIAPQDLDTLFQPFRQVDSRLAREREGTGLGLAISRRLAQLMGGDVTLASQPGRGSVFSLTLQRAGEAPR